MRIFEWFPALAILSLLVAASAGCSNDGLTPPPGWIEVREIPNTAAPVEDESARMQVFIHYGGVRAVHCSLRLVAPPQPPIIWDPGGRYGLGDPDFVRRNDLVTQPHPTLEQYWEYRGVRGKDSAMLMFEWELEPSRATQLREILWNGVDESDPRGRFDSNAQGLFCCRALCDFLMRFAIDVAPVPVRWWNPDELAVHLWGQGADRVRIRTRDGGERIFVGAGETSR